MKQSRSHFFRSGLTHAGTAHVRQQLSRHRTPKPLKTDAARREVVLAPAVTRLLRERWLASSYKEAEHLVFCRLSLHSLRHGSASLLIAQGLNVVFVSRQLGHASPAITLEVYPGLCVKTAPPSPRPSPSPREREAFWFPRPQRGRGQGEGAARTRTGRS
jgi:hypothetical protein